MSSSIRQEEIHGKDLRKGSNCISVDMAIP